MEKHTKGDRSHYAIDIYAPRNAIVLAPVSGTVIGVGNGTLGGNYVRILGSDGVTYYFAHMNNDNPVVYDGQKITAGKTIGYVGNTGSAKSTSTHLHFSMKQGSKPINPTTRLRGSDPLTGQGPGLQGMSSPPGAKTREEKEGEYFDPSDTMTDAELFPGSGVLAKPTFEFEPAEEGISDPEWMGQLEDFRNELLASQGKDPIKRQAKAQVRRSLMMMSEMVRRSGFGESGLSGEVQQIERQIGDELSS
jgi:hypothetical protein